MKLHAVCTVTIDPDELLGRGRNGIRVDRLSRFFLSFVPVMKFVPEASCVVLW